MYKPIIKSLFIFSAFFFVFNFARAGATISGLNNGLVGYYKFEEGAGTVITDSSGNKNHGTTTNMANPPTATSGWTDGKFGKALAFDGSNDYASVPGKNFDSSQELSVAAWIYDKDSSNQTHSINKDNNQTGERIWIIRNEDNSRVNWHIWNSSNALSQFSPSNSWTVNKWFFFVGTAKVVGSNIVMEVFFNGQSAGVTTFAGTAIKTNSSVPLRMGAAGNIYKKQMLDEVRIYNRALSASEVNKLYNMGATKFNAPQTKKLTNGLVGHWTFDGKDIVADTAIDRSGNNNNGTITKATKTTGKIGQALKFNGLNSYVKVASSTSLNITSASGLTISAWIKTATSTGSTIFQRFGNGPSTPFYRVAMGSGANNNKAGFQVRGMTGGETNLYSTNTVNNNNWRHIVGVRDTTADKLLIYIDGVLDNSTTDNSTGDLAIDKIPYIGVHGDGNSINGQYFNGLIDEVRIYNRALTASEVSKLYNMGASKFQAPQTRKLTDGLVGYWTFDGKDTASDGTALTVFDKSGNNNHGSTTGSAIPTKSAGKIGQALKFNGANNFITLPKNMLGTLSNYTFSAWVRPVINVTTKTIVGFPIYTTSSQYIRFGTDTGKMGLRFRDDLSGERSVLALQAATLNTWVHVVGVRDATNSSLRIYINGILNNSSVATNNTITTTDSSSVYKFTIGNWDGGDENFNGLIDEVRIYNRALTAGEVKRLYNMGR